MSGNAGTGGAAGRYRGGEGSAERRLIITNHHAEAELVDALGGHRQADEAATILCHEVDGVGGDLFGGHTEVALVLAVLVIHEDDHAARRVSSRASSIEMNGALLFSRGTNSPNMP